MKIFIAILLILSGFAVKAQDGKRIGKGIDHVQPLELIAANKLLNAIPEIPVSRYLSMPQMMTGPVVLCITPQYSGVCVYHKPDYDAVNTYTLTRKELATLPYTNLASIISLSARASELR